jgi:hypothetical protein
MMTEMSENKKGNKTGYIWTDVEFYLNNFPLRFNIIRISSNNFNIIRLIKRRAYYRVRLIAFGVSFIEIQSGVTSSQNVLHAMKRKIVYDTCFSPNLIRMLIQSA